MSFHPLADKTNNEHLPKPFFKDIRKSLYTKKNKKQKTKQERLLLSLRYFEVPLSINLLATRFFTNLNPNRVAGGNHGWWVRIPEKFQDRILKNAFYPGDPFFYLLNAGNNHPA